MHKVQPKLHLGGSADDKAEPDLQSMRGTMAKRLGQRWPRKAFKEALLEPPPGLQGGQKAKKASKTKDPALQRALKDHWDQLREAFKEKCTAVGVKVADPPATPDLPTLMKEHLQSLPADLKEAVEKLVAPDPPEPPLASKVKQAVGTLKQLTEKKAALQTKADAVKAQYTQLLQDLKELQGKIEAAQKGAADNHDTVQPAARE